MNDQRKPPRRSVTRIASLMALVVAGGLLGGCNPGDNPFGAKPPRYQQADERWQAASKRPPTPKTLCAMARILAAQNKDDEAKFILARVIQEHPRYLPAYVDLAEIHIRSRRMDAALDVLAEGLELAPRDAVLLNNVGMCHFLKGDYPPAMKSFRQATAGVPDNARYRANLAATLGMMGRYDEALALYQQTLSPADAHFNIAIICEARNDKERSAKEFSISGRLRREAAEAAARAAKGESRSPPTTEGNGKAEPDA